MMIKTVVCYGLLVLPEESLASAQDAGLIRALASLSVEQVRPSVNSLTFNNVPEKKTTL